MIRFYDVVFWTPKSNFEDSMNLLKSEFGLVPPSHDPSGSRARSQLVWEDSGRVGRWRVNFNSGQDFIEMDDPGGSGEKLYLERGRDGEPNMLFRYWSKRLNDWVERNDPMRDACLRIYDFLGRPKVTDQSFNEINLL